MMQVELPFEGSMTNGQCVSFHMGWTQVGQSLAWENGQLYGGTQVLFDVVDVT